MPLNRIRDGLDYLRRAINRRPAGFDARQFAERYVALYVPSGYSAQRGWPLLLMLHGCTQDAGDFARGTRMNDVAEHYGMIVAYPEQSEKANRKRCWNWFDSANQQRDSGELAELMQIVARLRSDYAVDPGRIYVAGISAGACLAVALAATYPDVFAAVGSVAGLEYRAASNVISGLAAMRMRRRRRPPVPLAQAMPLVLFHGTGDDVVQPLNSERLVQQWVGEHQVHLREDNGLALPPEWRGQRRVQRSSYYLGEGRVLVQRYLVEGMPHAWPGGSPSGSFTDPPGPDASAIMVDFFLRHRAIGPVPQS